MRCDAEDAWVFAGTGDLDSEMAMAPDLEVAVALGSEAVVRVSEMMMVPGSEDAAGFAVAEVEIAIR